MTVIRKQPDNKKKLLDLLKDIGIINANYSGKLVFNLSQGGLQDIEKIEKLNI